jgi:hypothetical protein
MEATEVYGKSDWEAIDSQIKRGMTGMIIGLAAAIAAITATLIVRIQWATMLVTVVWGSVSIFLWGMKLTPPRAYRKFLNEIHSGLSRETAGKVVSFSEDVSHREGLPFYQLVINIGDNKDPEDDRLYYWNAQKTKPAFIPGEHVKITSHGNDIIAYQKG